MGVLAAYIKGTPGFLGANKDDHIFLLTPVLPLEKFAFVAWVSSRGSLVSLGFIKTHYPYSEHMCMGVSSTVAGIDY